MNCYVCGLPTRIIDSRPRDYGVRRRRECTSCGARFTTVESPVVIVPRRSAARYDRGTMDRSGKPRQTGD